VRELAAFMGRVAGGRGAAARALDDERDAARAGLDAETWRGVCGAEVDLDLMRTLHRAASAGHDVARRARSDGEWIVGPAAPGQLRTKPQAFRLRDHVERAWLPGALKGGLARLLRDAAIELAVDPVACAARLVWSLSRAQPFIARNERVALMLVSRCLRGAGLPGLPVDDIERDPAFAAALIAATAEDRGALARYLAAAIWDAALAWAEWLGAPPPADPSRWTLADEHAALEDARRRASRIPAAELDALLSDAAELVRPAMSARLGAALGPCEHWRPIEHAQRLGVAVAGAQRGRRVCPHEPIAVLRWPVDGGLGVEVSLVAGAAGRGVTGATAMHLALAPRDAIGTGIAPAFLAIVDEPARARAARFEGWLDAAIPQLLDRCALRA
jgi:hypothetical protein